MQISPGAEDALASANQKRGAAQERGAVLMVGHRSPAIAAALRLGCEIVLVSETPPPRRSARQLAAFSCVDFAATRPRLLAAMREAIGRREIAGVLALTERSVPVAGLFRETLGLPGLGASASYACHHKPTMKEVARRGGLYLTDHVIIDESTRLQDLVERLGLPTVVKAAASSGSRGTVIARDLGSLSRAMKPGMIAETFITGEEMSVEIFIASGSVILTNLTEYLEPLWASLAPANLMPEMVVEVERFAARVVRAFEITNGLVHIEIYRTRRGPVFGELTVRPPGGYLMEILETAYGFDPWAAVIRLETGHTIALPGRAIQYSAARLIHPGAGCVRAITGLEAARAVPGVVDIRLNLEPGDLVPHREGSGQDRGRILVAAPTRDQAASALADAAALIQIEMER